MYFQKSKNRQCPRGLHFDYHLDKTAPISHLVNRLNEAFEGRLFHLEDPLAGHQLMRFIVKFVAEIRLDEQGDVVSIIHRISASPQRRLETECLVERVLEDA